MAKLPINRFQLAALAGVIIFAYLPFSTELAWGVNLAVPILLLARVAVSFGWVASLAKYQKLVLVVAGISIIAMSYSSVFSLDAMVSLLLIMWSAKFLEAQRLRDAYILLLLAFFVAFCGLLYAQTLLFSLWALALCLASLSILVFVHSNRFRQSLATATSTGIASLVIASMLFVLLPATGSLWQIPLQRDRAVTGLSDRVSPGDIASLAQSNATAFRVEKARGDYPPPRDRYWRALVLDYFDGRAWRTGRYSPAGYAPQRMTNCEHSDYEYTVTVEPHFQPWLFQLQGADSPSAELRRYSNQTLRAEQPLAQRLSYRLCEAQQHELGQGLLTQDQRNYYLRLSDNNPMATAWGQELAQLASTEAVVEAVLQHYFYNATYTLEPPGLGADSVDEFLFQTQRGFCEHFASSFSFVMRAAGIPSRVVVGYQGGEESPFEPYLRVAQSDAHAWAEIFVDGQGWVQVDPTAYVAPERIERGLDGDGEAVSWLADQGWLQSSSNELLRRLALRLDAVNYRFANWVSGFNEQRRQGWLDGVGIASLWQSAAVLFAAILVCISGSLGWQKWRDRPRYSAAAKRYRRALKVVMRSGIQPNAGETPQQFLTRVEATEPSLASALAIATQRYYQEEYGG
ncbi:transglutaminase TgpA family protein [Umboniibacter marinipuniceus]|uniref:Transglutaminase-like putative cysteine protease n=1 Tax=Umboniibacter marinipuniceus TaxID=569599 RepID=A0A3M0A1C9_9GAMM|nr:DUF3488 and transglutaminase-like domain-containing protein [Umboniibacter marinipuniceus]RMA78961.1 transglutaminase-like putative cysteine protease [Umboniibacter marinipuniceus]